MLRSILGIKIEDKVTIKDIHEKTNAKNIGYKIQKLKIEYAGHGRG